MSSLSSRQRGRILREGAVYESADLNTVTARVARSLVIAPALIEEAAEDGFRTGYDAGFTAGLEDSAAAIDSRERVRSQQLQSVLERLSSEADALAMRYDDAIAHNERMVIDVAFEIAQAVLGRELRHMESRAVDALGRALQFAPPTGPVVARLHPDDFRSLGDDANSLAGRSITTICDATLTPGDAIVDVGSARIDARIAPALDRIREVLEA